MSSALHVQAVFDSLRCRQAACCGDLLAGASQGRTTRLGAAMPAALTGCSTLMGRRWCSNGLEVRVSCKAPVCGQGTRSGLSSPRFRVHGRAAAHCCRVCGCGRNCTGCCCCCCCAGPILMHSTMNAMGGCPQALKRLIPYWKSHGYKFVKVGWVHCGVAGLLGQ